MKTGMRLPLYEGVDWNWTDHHKKGAWRSLPLYEGVDWNSNNGTKTTLTLWSPSLRGSGLKLCQKQLSRQPIWSPSLRGSGLKYSMGLNRADAAKVSLFTREWIEMLGGVRSAELSISLPLYEGVDWNIFYILLFLSASKSPSLRGSGLKSLSCCAVQFRSSRLPLYEGVDWNGSPNIHLVIVDGLPLYEGVDWNWHPTIHFCKWWCLPLYEGVDWNQSCGGLTELTLPSPSLRGSGLKLTLSRNWCPS